MTTISFGLDRLLAEPLLRKSLAGRRVALLAHPASVDSLPTSAGQEDHVSMAPWAGRKLLEVCQNTSRVLAIELLSAAQAIDCMKPLETTPELQRVHATVRAAVAFRAHDHRLDRDIDALTALVQSGRLSTHLALHE